jgi:hypothetical protein
LRDVSAPVEIARGFGPRWFRRGLALLAAVYLAGIFTNSAKINTESPRVVDELLYYPIEDPRVLPHWFRYFIQIACLFPHAKPLDIDYRVQGYECSTGLFAEIDTRPYFPIHADDKENRLYRAGHMFRRNNVVMAALDDYLVSRHNARAARGEVEPIGGILFMSLRIPLPEPGGPVERYRRKPLREFPNKLRKPWYRTDRELQGQRCQEWRR